MLYVRSARIMLLYRCKHHPVRAYRLIDPSPRTDDVNPSKLFVRYLEHSLQLLPVHHVGLLEDRTGSSLGSPTVSIHDLLRLRTETQVRQENVASILQQELCEAEVNS